MIGQKYGRKVHFRKIMPLTIQDWHNRFLLQAQWTKALRLYFFDLIQIDPADKILDIGCGTGALLPDLESLSPATIYGADVSQSHLEQALQTSQESILIGADVHHLPFIENEFDMVVSHYFLMWIGDASHAIQELCRVIKPGGYLVAFAEPDYGGRIDYPPEFINLREHQISGLLQAGADPRMGRKLRYLFHEADLEEVHCGVYDGRWEKALDIEDIESDWLMLEEDLKNVLSSTEIKELRKHEQKAIENGYRLIYVPTFYAWGKIPE
jgi:ubiquinone/menaquinone biosynthesis C-methylase UbiE